MATQVLERISSTSLVELEHRTLDNMFDDLGHHILNNSLDAASLEQVISTRCIPNELPTDIKSFKKFVLQGFLLVNACSSRHALFIAWSSSSEEKASSEEEACFQEKTCSEEAHSQ